MKVKDVMHKGVDWVSPETPITEIARLMQAHDIGCIPIGEDDHLILIVANGHLLFFVDSRCTYCFSCREIEWCPFVRFCNENPRLIRLNN